MAGSLDQFRRHTSDTKHNGVIVCGQSRNHMLFLAGPDPAGGIMFFYGGTFPDGIILSGGAILIGDAGVILSGETVRHRS